MDKEKEITEEAVEEVIEDREDNVVSIRITMGSDGGLMINTTEGLHPLFSLGILEQASSIISSTLMKVSDKNE